MKNWQLFILGISLSMIATTKTVFATTPVNTSKTPMTSNTDNLNQWLTELPARLDHQLSLGKITPDQHTAIKKMIPELSAKIQSIDHIDPKNKLNASEEANVRSLKLSYLSIESTMAMGKNSAPVPDMSRKLHRPPPATAPIKAPVK